MKSINIPSGRSRYPEIAAHTVMEARMVLGGARIGVSWFQVPGGVMPEVAVHFISENGGQSILRYRLQPDTPERAERQVALLIGLIHNELSEENTPAAA